MKLHHRKFARFFPSYHPRAGEPTYFVEKLVNAWHKNGIVPFDIRCGFDETIYHACEPKYHTIRVGHHVKPGDFIRPSVWGDDINPKSGRKGPYHSKQIIIGPDIEVVKVWDIGLRIEGDFKEFYCGDPNLTGVSIDKIALNDGLNINDFFSWFNKPFTGQIICWSKDVEY